MDKRSGVVSLPLGVPRSLPGPVSQIGDVLLQLLFESGQLFVPQEIEEGSRRDTRLREIAPGIRQRRDDKRKRSPGAILAAHGVEVVAVGHG